MSSANLAIGPKSSYLYFPVFFRGFLMVFQLVPLGSGHVGRAAASARRTILNESSLQFMGTVLGEVVEPKQSRSDRTPADDVAWFVPGPKDIIPLVGQREGARQVVQILAKLLEMQDAEQFDIQSS